MQHLFKDKVLNDQFDRDGFVKASFASPDVLQSLRELFLAYCPKGSHDSGQVFYSFFCNSAEKNFELKKKMASVLMASYERIFENFQSFGEMFLAKYSDNKELALHQDWSHVRESESPSLTLWLPLQETNINNGALFVIPGSHKFFETYRSGSLPSARITLDLDLQNICSSIELKAGEAAFFHPALFHGSHPNLGSSPRLVAASMITAANDQAIYFHKPRLSDTIKAYKLTDLALYQNLEVLNRGEIYEAAEKIGDIHYAPTDIDKTLLIENFKKRQHAL